MSTNPKRSQTVRNNTTGGVKSSSVVFDLSNPNFNLVFFHYLTIPDDTQISSPVSYDLSLPVGMINKLWVEFPRGCAGLVGLRILRGVNQIFPLPDTVWMRSDNAVFDFRFSHVISSEPLSVTIQGYNIDDTYHHTVWVGFEMSGIMSKENSKLIEFLKVLE